MSKWIGARNPPKAASSLVAGVKRSIRLPENSEIHSAPLGSNWIWLGLSRPRVGSKNVQEVSLTSPGTSRTIRLLPKSAIHSAPSEATARSEYAKVFVDR